LPSKEESDMKKKARKGECCAEVAAAGSSCCADSAALKGAGAAAVGPAAEVRRKFLDFHKQATATPGAVDAATKEAVSVALSLVTRCGPCTKFHLAKAREMGFSEQEIEELALMAVAFGGCPVMMFYNEMKKS
jgi:AhpD family alkylhydroperoxidase